MDDYMTGVTAMTTRAAPQLTDTDRDTINRGRAVLAEDPPSGYELADMAARIGALEWHLDAALRLAERLGGDGA